jgi:hypothetical protein
MNVMAVALEHDGNERAREVTVKVRGRIDADR